MSHKWTGAFGYQCVHLNFQTLPLSDPLKDALKFSIWIPIFGENWTCKCRKVLLNNRLPFPASQLCLYWLYSLKHLADTCWLNQHCISLRDGIQLTMYSVAKNQRWVDGVMVSKSAMIVGDPSCLHREYKSEEGNWRCQPSRVVSLRNYSQFKDRLMIPAPNVQWACHHHNQAGWYSWSYICLCHQSAFCQLFTECQLPLQDNQQ